MDLQQRPIMEMEYGEIAGNPSVNVMIYQCFGLLDKSIARAFVKKFRDQLKDEHQVMHTFRELLVGAFVADQRFRAEYEPTIDNQTPDWRFFGLDSGPAFILDVVNFHPAKVTENKQTAALAKDHIWCDWLGPNTNRLYSSLQDKAAKYKGLLEKQQCPYVIGLYPSFFAAFSPDDLLESVNPPDGIFLHYPQVSGVLVFEDGGFPALGRPLAYRFSYLPNPSASRPISIRAGSIPIPSPV